MITDYIFWFVSVPNEILILRLNDKTRKRHFRYLQTNKDVVTAATIKLHDVKQNRHHFHFYFVDALKCNY